MVANGNTIEQVLKDLFGSDTESNVEEEDCGDGLENREVKLEVEGCPQGLVHVKDALNVAVQVDSALGKQVSMSQVIGFQF